MSGERTRIANAHDRLATLETRARNAFGQSLIQRRERGLALTQRADRAFGQALHRRADRLASLWALIRSLGPEAVLSRGYALIRDEAGTLVRSIEAAQPGRALSVQLADGSFGVTVAGGEAGGTKPSAPRPVRKVPTPGTQGNLF